MVGVYVYRSELISGVLIVPFSQATIDIGAWIIPLVALIYLATTNAVNLTDGLDGLAGSTTMTYMLSFVMLMLVLLQTVFASFSPVVVGEMKNLSLISAVSVGAMLSFLVFNCFPAKIFM